MAARKSPLHLLGHGRCRLARRRGDARRRLGRQIELELLHQELLFGVQFSVAAQDQRAAIGGREVDVARMLTCSPAPGWCRPAETVTYSERASIWRPSAGSRGSDPRPLGPTMGGRPDRTCGERPRASRIATRPKVGPTNCEKNISPLHTALK